MAALQKDVGMPVQIHNLPETAQGADATSLQKSANSNENISSDSADIAKLPERSKLSLLVMKLRKISEHDMHVSISCKKKSFHSRLLLLEDGKIVILDKADRILKLVSKDYKLTHHVVLKSDFRDIAFVCKNLIALAYKKEIVIFRSCCKELYQCWSYDTRDHISSMASTDDNIAILFVEKERDGYKMSVQIRTCKTKY